MLDTKNMTKKMVDDCRETEKWLQKFVKKHAPNVGYECEELRVNDEEDDEYIFCEVVFTIGGKNRHRFNFYAGAEEATLVERLGGRRGQVANGEHMGRYFEMHFARPSLDDTGKLQDYLENLTHPEA